MLLQIDDKFKISTDSSLQNYQLEKLEPVKNKQSGEIVRSEYKIIGYHGGSLKSVLLQYSREAVIDDDNLKNINDVLHKLDEINKTIERVVKKQNIRMDIKSDDE